MTMERTNEKDRRKYGRKEEGDTNTEGIKEGRQVGVRNENRKK
jgi:hypothetical protein